MNATPTASLLWAACRPAPDVDAVRGAVERGADLALAAEVAVSQRVSPLLDRALDDAGVPRDAEWSAALDDDVARVRAHAALVLPRAMTSVLEPLHEAGLEPLVLKGGAICERYPAAGLRPMDDLDVMLPATTHRAAIEALSRAGWHEIPTSPAVHHEVFLTHRDLPGMPLELHRAFAVWRETSHGLGPEALWNRRRPAVLFGAPAFVLGAEDEILFGAAHAGKPFHFFNRLIWAVDAVVAIANRRDPDQSIDWQLMDARARAAGCRTALAITLAHARRLGADVPPLMTETLAARSRHAALAPVLSPEWPLIARDPGVRTRLRYAVADRARHRITLFIGDVTVFGLARAPGRLVGLTSRGLRRWWALRRGREPSPATALTASQPRDRSIQG